MNTLAAPAPEAAQPRRAAHPAWLVFCREWAEWRRDARWRWLLALTLVLMGTALVLGLQSSARLAHLQAHAAEGDRAVWLAQGAKNPHAAAHFGQYAFKPVGPLALADPGVDAYVGQAVWMEAHRQNESQFRPARDGTLAARLGQLSLAFVLQTLLPLVALLLGHAAWAAEREQGTLRALLALGARPLQLLAGKSLAVCSLVGLLLLVAGGGLGLGLILAGQGLAAEAGAGWRIAGLLGVYGLYLGGFVALALAASAALRDSRLALVLLLGFWLINAFVAPRWASEAARAAVPLPTAAAFRQAITEEKRRSFGHDEQHPAFVAFRERVLREHGVSRVEELPFNFRGLALREDDRIGYLVFDRHFGRLFERIEAQDRQRARAGLVFPLLAVQPLSMALAGTDNRHQHHFLVSAEQHRRLIQDLLSEHQMRHAGSGTARYEAPASLWAQVPAFAYPAPGPRWAWRGQQGHLLSLVAWFGVTALLAALSIRRLRAD